MDFALIGDDPAVLPLIQAIAEAPEHRLTHAANVGAFRSDLKRCCTSVDVVERWELLPIESIDAVIVSGRDQATFSAAKQIVSHGRQILFFPQAAQGLGVIYELTLSRDESHANLIPIFLDRFDPRVVELQNVLERGELGRILHLQVEAELAPNPRPNGRVLLSAEQVDERLLRDVELLRTLAGEYNQVTAVYSQADGSGLAMANVTLSAEGVSESSWSMKPTAGRQVWKLTVTGEDGSAILSVDGEDNGYQLQILRSAEAVEHYSNDKGDECRSLIKSLERVMHDESARPNWTDLTRDFEIVEATHRSIARRRTIDLHFETTSERSVFKSQMTVAGCALLVLTLLSLLGLLAAGALLDNRDALQVNSESVGFVIDADDFRLDSAELSVSGHNHVESIARRMAQVPHSVLIAKSDDDNLDDRRRQTVTVELKQLRAPDVERRTLIVELRGQTVSWLMKIARVAWVIPLVLFLVLQILLFVAKPSSESREKKPSQRE